MEIDNGGAGRTTAARQAHQGSGRRQKCPAVHGIHGQCPSARGIRAPGPSPDLPFQVPEGSGIHPMLSLVPWLVILRSTGSVSVWGFRWAESVWRGSGFRDGATRCLHNPCPYAIGRRCPMRPAGSPQALERSCQGFAARAADSHSRGRARDAAFAPLRLDCGLRPLADSPSRGSDTGAPYASLKITPPLRGSRRSRAARRRLMRWGVEAGHARSRPSAMPGRFSTVLIY